METLSGNAIIAIEREVTCVIAAPEAVNDRTNRLYNINVVSSGINPAKLK